MVYIPKGIYLTNFVYGKQKMHKLPGLATPGGSGGHSPTSPLFCVARRKKRNKGTKERDSKQKLLKGCHQSQNVTVLAILEHLEFKNFYC